MKTILSFFAIILLASSVFSQQVWMLDGRIYTATDKIELDSNGLTVLNKHNKELKVDTSDVFCIIYGNDTTFYYSEQNPTLQQATMFMKGQIDGSNYKNFWLNAGAFATGLAAPIGLFYGHFSPFLSPVVSGIYVSTATAFPPNIEKNIADEKLRQNKYYVAGFKYGAARKKVKTMTLWSVAGLATGVVTTLILDR